MSQPVIYSKRVIEKKEEYMPNKTFVAGKSNDHVERSYAT